MRDIQNICLIVATGLLLLIGWSVGVRLEQSRKQDALTEERLSAVEKIISLDGKAVRFAADLKRRGLVLTKGE